MKRELESDKTIVSVVIPVYNEKEGLDLLHRSLIQTIDSWRERGWKIQTEIILVVDRDHLSSELV